MSLSDERRDARERALGLLYEAEQKGCTGAEVLDVQVGLRPARPEVRLELDGIAECLVLHHYGHGGAGLTLSWGSALEAVQMARNVKM